LRAAGCGDDAECSTADCESARGKANATIASLATGLPRKLPPVAVTATNCLPLLPRYVIGVACAEASSFAIHSSRPVAESNARKRLSSVAPMKTSPAAVAIEPPTLGLPVRCRSSGRLSLTPSTLCQTISPLSRSSCQRADPGTHGDLGIAYKQMGLYDAAIAEFKLLQQDRTRAVFALTMIGECVEAKGELGEAVGKYKEALNLSQVTSSESLELYYLLGSVFERLGDVREALYFFENLRKRDATFRDVGRRIAALKPATASQGR